MKRILHRIIPLILIICMLFGIVGCNDGTVPSANIQFDVEGNQLEETILYEQLLKEDILDEEQLGEFTLETIQLIEDNLSEDVLVEDIQVEVMLADDIEGALDEYFSSEVMLYDIDWGTVIGKFAVGTAVIIVTAVLSVATSGTGFGVVFATSCKEALKEGLIGGAVGGALGVISGALESGGKVSAIQKYAIEGAADGFMWGAISGAVLGAYKGYQNYYIDSKQIYNGSKYVGKIDGLHIVDNSGETVGYVTSNGWAVSTTGEAIGKLDDVGNVIKGAESLIPATGKITGSTGRVKYTINAANQVIDKTGAVVGSINDAGQIYTSSNTLLGMVDDSGTLLSGLQKTINAGYKVDFAGQIINKTITKTTTIGEQIYEQIYYLDDAGNKIGQLMTTKDSGKTISYVTKFVDPSTVKVNGEIPKSGLEKVVGQIDDTGSLVTEWNKFFQVERSTGVKRAWQQEKALVKATGKGTYKTWTEQQISELLAKGKVSGYQGHHICSALYSPQLAANPDNIAFYSAIEHLQIAHQGNYQTITFGTLLSRAIPAMAIAA